MGINSREIPDELEESAEEAKHRLDEAWKNRLGDWKGVTQALDRLEEAVRAIAEYEYKP